MLLCCNSMFWNITKLIKQKRVIVNHVLCLWQWKQGVKYLEVIIWPLGDRIALEVCCSCRGLQLFPPACLPVRPDPGHQANCAITRTGFQVLPVRSERGWNMKWTTDSDIRCERSSITWRLKPHTSNSCFFLLFLVHSSFFWTIAHSCYVSVNNDLI